MCGRGDGVAAASKHPEGDKSVAKLHPDRLRDLGPAYAAEALWYMGPGRTAIQSETLAPLGAGMVRVEALFGAVSRGTENLVFRGLVPESEYERMRAPFQSGDYPFPVKHGYACVGRVVAGDAALEGRTVFVLHPHQTLFDVPRHAVHLVPDHVPARRAVLAANMETALNALWDGGLAPGDHIAVVGAGVVGALTAFLAAKMPGTRVTLFDKNPEKARVAAALGVTFGDPENTRGDNDLVIHASASEEGLNAAIALCGEEATVVELSWYGDRKVAVGLGGAFHSRRLKIVSSQVGQLPATRQARWTNDRRLATAIELLADDRLDALLEEPCAFRDLPARMPHIFGADCCALCQTVRYPAAD